MNFNILGPLEVRDPEGREIRLPAGRERSLLVLLVIKRGEVVSVDRIVDALWGDRPPGTAAKAVQVYVSHLRRLLGEAQGPAGAEGLLLTRAPGYALRADDVAVDAARFERLAGEGRRALEDGSPAEAARLLDEALALWRGPALADFAFDDFAQDEIRRLEESRLGATEDRIDALLRLGRLGGLVGELDSLVAAHPLRERLRGLSMLALYRSGRQADALQVYRDGRRLLDAELGLEPGPELQRLERAILAQDPGLEAPPPPARETGREPDDPRPSGPRDRRRRLAAAGVAAAAAIAAVLAVVLTRDDAPAAVAAAVPALIAVDPETNRVVASIAVGSKPASVAVGDGAVWVGDARDGTVTRIDPATRRVVQTIGIGAPAIDVAAGAGGVWVATGGFGTIVRIDPEVGGVSDRIELGDPDDPVVPAASAVEVGDGRVWVGSFDGLVRLDPDSGEVIGRVNLGQAPARQIAVGDGAVWATLRSRRAKRVEAVSGQVTADFYAGRFIFAVALDRSAAWVGAGDDGGVWKLDPVTGSTVFTARAGKGVAGIALGLGGVWVTSWPDGPLLRLDPATGEVVATIQTGGEPQGVAVGGGLVWVAVQTLDGFPG
jgi:DNA-binding SARP family transcriptional activator/streptogramin lyase